MPCVIIVAFALHEKPGCAAVVTTRLARRAAGELSERVGCLAAWLRAGERALLPLGLRERRNHLVAAVVDQVGGPAAGVCWARLAAVARKAPIVQL